MMSLVREGPQQNGEYLRVHRSVGVTVVAACVDVRVTFLLVSFMQDNGRRCVKAVNVQ
jgi:hypothetical protein